MFQNVRLFCGGLLLGLFLGWLGFRFWPFWEIWVGAYGLLIPSCILLVFFIIKWKHSKWFYSGCLVSVLIVLVVDLGFGWARFVVRSAFKDGVKIIRKLEQYKIQTGHYPDTLAKVGLKDGGYYSKYDYDSAEDSFFLEYKVVFDGYYYRSKTGEWSGDLPPGGPPYDIINGW